jgi:hypothetical protein
VAPGQIVRRRRRPQLDEPEFQRTARLNDSLRAIDVGHAGQLNQDFVAGGSLPGDARLCDAQLVDSAFDRFHRPRHRVVSDRCFRLG